MTAQDSMEVLLIEDSRSDALLTLKALTDSSNIKVTHVDSLEPALKLADERVFDAVVLDLGLPDSFGIQTLERTRVKFPNVPIIILSAAENENLVESTISAGAGEFILKRGLHRENLQRTVRHVVERHSLIAALRESETRKNGILNCALCSIITFDRKGKIVDVNRTATTMFGFEREDILGIDFTSMFSSPRLSMLFAAETDNSFREPTTVVQSFETSAICADGQEIPIELSVASIACDDTYCFTAFIEDLRRRKHLETEARLLNEALQTVAQGILITDAQQPDNPIIFASRGFESLSGYQSSEVIGRNCRFLQGPGSDPATVAKIRQSLAAGEPFSGELLNYKKDGREFWNSMYLSPIRDAAGDLTHFVGIQVDVTERRKLEEQLRQSQKMEAIGQLAGGVAHDFNNMLAVILGYTDTLLKLDYLGSEAQEALREIHKAGQSAASVTRQLLAFSRKQLIEPEVLDLNAVVSDLNKMLSRLLGEDIELTASLGRPLSPIRFDRGQLEQVLVNIAVNARDAMPKGGRLDIQTRNVSLPPPPHGRAFQSPREVELIITDTGTGMEEATRSRVFEPFFTTKGPGEGTGLGLASVYGIIQQAGGYISVESELDRGTTFTIRIPALEVSAQTSEAIHAPELERGTETILLVEDEEMLRKMLIKGLTGLGYRMIGARDGNEALALASRHAHPIDLLVTDLVMPQMSGRTLSHQLLIKRPGVKVLYMSGYTDDVIVRHDIENTVEFLQKPFSVATLAQKIRSILD